MKQEITWRKDWRNRYKLDEFLGFFLMSIRGSLLWRLFWALGKDVRYTVAQRKRDEDPFAFHDSDSEDSDMEYWNFS